MDVTAFCLSISILIPVLIAIFLPLMISGKAWIAADEKAHARRLADAQMNARLLRFNL